MSAYPKKIDFLGIRLDAITMDETLETIDQTIKSSGKLNHVVINAWTVVAMQSDNELRENITSCDLINADGISIVWAARFLGKHMPERVPGTEIMENMVKLAAKKGYRCFFLGAHEEVVKEVVNIYGNKLGTEVVAGYRNGYFSKDEEKAVAISIRDSGAKLLFIAMPSPQKENFIFNYRHILSNVNYNLGVGGAFDVVAGVTKRAPKWMQKNGLEWFYRFIQEPRRMWKRYFIGNFQFVFLIMKEKFR